MKRVVVLLLLGLGLGWGAGRWLFPLRAEALLLCLPCGREGDLPLSSLDALKRKIGADSFTTDLASKLENPVLREQACLMKVEVEELEPSLARLIIEARDEQTAARLCVETAQRICAPPEFDSRTPQNLEVQAVREELARQDQILVEALQQMEKRSQQSRRAAELAVGLRFEHYQEAYEAAQKSINASRTEVLVRGVSVPQYVLLDGPTVRFHLPSVWCGILGALGGIFAAVFSRY